VLTKEERRTLATIVDTSLAVRFISLHFGAKEAVYKSVEAKMQSMLDFDMVELNVDAQHLSREGEWLTVQARIRGVDDEICVSARFDGNWVLSAAKRD
jgi:4'-phosphopantetheinyl transferase EntD